MKNNIKQRVSNTQDIRTQMFDLILEADDLCLPHSVSRTNSGEHCVDFVFDTTDCPYNIGKKRMNYGIPTASISADGNQSDVDGIRKLFDQVRSIDAAEADRQNVVNHAKAKLSDGEKVALGLN